MHDWELVGSVLHDTPDPIRASRVLFQLLTAECVDIERARAEGLEPVLVQSLKRRLPADRRALELACLSGAAWVLGRRSTATVESWEVVATTPAGAGPLPPGVRRTTGETLIGLASSARHRIRLVAPYVDEGGIQLLTDAFAAATTRGVMVEVFEPEDWEAAHAALGKLRRYIADEGDASYLRVIRVSPTARFAHLKVMVVDGSAAYIGSANITGAGLAGRNLELGVLVRGARVAVIDAVLDFYVATVAG